MSETALSPHQIFCLSQKTSSRATGGTCAREYQRDFDALVRDGLLVPDGHVPGADGAPCAMYRASPLGLAVLAAVSVGGCGGG